MSRKAVLGIASSRSQVERIANQLTAAGLSASDIAVLVPDRSGAGNFVHEQDTMALYGVGSAGAGGVVGGGIGWMVGLGSLAIPGVGPFVSAGPIVAVLAGAAPGARPGGLVGLGIPEYEANRYEGRIRRGSMLVYVRADDGTAIDRAREIFEREGAHDISDTDERPSAPPPPPNVQVTRWEPVRVNPSYVPSRVGLVSEHPAAGESRAP